MLNNVISTVVTFILEGMHVAGALTLVMVARRMKAANVLRKGLSTVETLGCVNVICSDKTGTPTQNQIHVSSIAFVDELIAIQEVCSSLASDNFDAGVKKFHQAASLCNDYF
ncbi:hypothetical protein V8C35DRAFT_12825 [Trichoderma chlorosporum]